ncbi:unnamed protein product [Dimorphilus gyrociliatus]|uniref:G-protein coupled receptors family 1 profile domain-containing protein n=1 Tax=Dimorphilus gyrociliatus TaxID=2664684 RepID=A0A7I8VBK2_9ANNE|nr:unnamed protein product [Dimorphilus gyrociliatus]
MVAYYILKVHKANSVVTTLLRCLAVVDNFYLFASVCVPVFKTACDVTNIGDSPYCYYYVLSEPYFWTFASCSQTAANWLILLITIDRYIAICHPFHPYKLTNSSRARLCAFVVICLAVLYNSPRLFEYDGTATSVIDLCTNKSRYIKNATKMRRDGSYFIFYKVIAYFLFRAVGPIFTLFVLNLKLIQCVKEAQQRRVTLTRTIQQKVKSQRILTITLIGVVSASILLQLPNAAVRAALSAMFLMKVKLNQLKYAATFTNMLLVLNSAINCAIYCLTGRQFRKFLIKKCCGCTIKNKTTVVYRATFGHRRSGRALATVPLTRETTKV